MQQTRDPQTSDPGMLPWLGFWAQFLVLGFLVVVGAAVASRSDPGDYTTGMILSLAAIALAFMRLKHHFDGGAAVGWGNYLLVDTMGNLVFAIVVFVILGLGGLIVAASAEYGALHEAGIALFVAAALMVFLSVKRVFDNIDAHH